METEKDTFPINEYDLELVSNAITLTRDILRLPELSSKDLLGLVRVLYALERLPESSKGVDVGYGIIIHRKNEIQYWGVSISDSRFEISSGGSIYTEGVGSDSYTDFYFEAETGEYKDSKGDSYSWFIRAYEALGMNPQINITDLSEPDCMERD